jgi:hypothetical protein
MHPDKSISGLKRTGDFFAAVKKTGNIHPADAGKFRVNLTKKKLKNLNVFLEKTLAFFARTW